MCTVNGAPAVEHENTSFLCSVYWETRNEEWNARPPAQSSAGYVTDYIHYGVSL